MRPWGSEPANRMAKNEAVEHPGNRWKLPAILCCRHTPRCRQHPFQTEIPAGPAAWGLSAQGERVLELRVPVERNVSAALSAFLPW